MLKCCIQISDGSKLLRRQPKSLHILPLELHRRMHISVQRNAGIRMTKQLTQSFRIKSMLHANRRVGVSNHMKVHDAHTTVLQNPAKTILHRSRLRRLGCPGNQISVSIPHQFGEQCGYKLRNWNSTNRTSAFRRTNDYFGCSGVVNSLYCPVYRNHVVFQVNILPSQTAKLPDTQACKQAQQNRSICPAWICKQKPDQFPALISIQNLHLFLFRFWHCKIDFPDTILSGGIYRNTAKYSHNIPNGFCGQRCSMPYSERRSV